MKGSLTFKDGTKIEGRSFGYEGSVAGEIVFTTGMVGYPEAMTDPSYTGEILIFTYPIIGSYGIADKKTWESDGIKTKGIIVSNYIDTPSHFSSKMTLSAWLKKEKVPALEIKDTRYLTQKIRTEGTMLGKITINKQVDWYDPDKENLVSYVSSKKPLVLGSGKKHIVMLDCGAKRNISEELLKRGVKLTIVPWDYDIFTQIEKFDGVLISNGPGNPKRVTKTIETVRKALDRKMPILGICLGNQILTLAAGGDTTQMKFGHRSQNQPCLLEGTNKAYLTTQNHGYVVNKIPKGFKTWFTNVNDGTNEGIIHTKYPFMAVQFHPEATPGPVDTSWIFDFFLKKI